MPLTHEFVRLGTALIEGSCEVDYRHPDDWEITRVWLLTDRHGEVEIGESNMALRAELVIAIVKHRSGHISDAIRREQNDAIVPLSLTRPMTRIYQPARGDVVPFGLISWGE